MSQNTLPIDENGLFIPPHSLQLDFQVLSTLTQQSFAAHLFSMTQNLLVTDVTYYFILETIVTTSVENRPDFLPKTETNITLTGNLNIPDGQACFIFQAPVFQNAPYLITQLSAAQPETAARFQLILN